MCTIYRGLTIEEMPASSPGLDVYLACLSPLSQRFGPTPGAAYLNLQLLVRLTVVTNNGTEIFFSATKLHYKIKHYY